MTQSRNVQKTNIGGIILVMLGIYFLLNNFDLIPYNLNHYIFNWKGILIVIGIYQLSSRPNKQAGYILIGIGSLFILSTIYRDMFGHFLELRDVFWPVALIIVGLIILSKKKSFHTNEHHPNASSPDYLDDTVILGGGDVIIQSDNFKGGRINAIFGGSSYDLTNSTLANENNFINVFAMFGGVSFKVPSDWNIHLEVTAIFGGFADKRKHINNTSIDTKGTLFIKGFVMFGGGEIKNY